MDNQKDVNDCVDFLLRRRKKWLENVVRREEMS